MIKDIHSLPLRSPEDGSSLSNTIYRHEIFDQTFLYKRNSEGYRSEEFVNNPKFLFAGCSETFGESGDYETTWAYKLFNKIKDPNDTYCNIGVPGIDTSLVIHHVLMFIDKYGKPENLFVMFPQFNRMIETSKYTVSTVTFGDIPTKPNHSQHSNVMFVEERIINAVQSSNLLQVKNFESVCKKLGINLFWSTWCANSNHKIVEENIYDNYCCTINGEEVADLAEELGYELNENSITRADKNHHGEIFHEYWSNVLCNKYKENIK